MCIGFITWIAWKVDAGVNWAWRSSYDIGFTLHLKIFALSSSCIYLYHVKKTMNALQQKIDSIETMVMKRTDLVAVQTSTVERTSPNSANHSLAIKKLTESVWSLEENNKKAIIKIGKLEAELDCIDLDVGYLQAEIYGKPGRGVEPSSQVFKKYQAI